MADKELKISSKTDDQGLKKFTRSLRELQSIIKGFNQTIGSLNTMFSKFGSELTKEINSMGKFRDSLKSTQNVIKDQGRALKEYANNIKTVSGGGGGGGGGRGIGGMQLLPLPGGGFIAVPPGGGGGGGAAGGPAGGGRGTQPGQFQTAKNFQYAFDAGRHIADVVQTSKSAYFTNLAAVQGLRGQTYRNILQGDISDALAVSLYQGGGFPGLIDKTGGRAAGYLGAAGKAASNLTSSVPGGPVAAGAGAAKSVFDIGAALGTGAVPAAEAGSMQTSINAIKEAFPDLMARVSLFQQAAPALMMGNRRLGGEALRAAGVGARAGMQPGEAISLFSGMANQFGEQAVMGPRMVRDVLRENTDTNQFVLGREGAKGVGMADFVSDLAKKGLDPQMMGQLLGQMGSVPGVRTAAQRNDSAFGALSDAVASGIAKGIKEPSTLEALAQAVGGAVVAGGTTRGAGALGDFLTAGLGKETANPQIIAQRMSGLQALGEGIQNNPFMAVWARQSAKDILGKGSSALGVGALGGSTLTELLGPNRFLDSLGLSKGQRMGEFQSQMNNLLKMVTAEGGATAGPEVQRLQQMMGGQGFAGLKGNQSGQDLFAAILTQFGMPKEQIGILSAAVGAMADMGNNPASDKGFDRAKNIFDQLQDRGGLAGAQQAAQSGAQVKGLSDLLNDKTSVKAISGMFANFGQIMDTAARVPNWDTAKDFIAELENLVKAINTGTIAKFNKIIAASPPKTKQ